jgi:hypothetical protein
MVLSPPVNPHGLDDHEALRIVETICDVAGVGLRRADFVSRVWDVFEHIPGFETMAPAMGHRIAHQLWSLYMSKKTTKPESATEAGEPTPGAAAAAPIDLSSPVLQKAIGEGKALIADGKSKADAARAIYAAISTEPKDVIVAAFIEGATLTPKGALTYWYNNRRKAAKASKEA